MAKIFAPNKQYTGLSAGVAFAKGKAETDNPHLIEWFRVHGYQVEDTASEAIPENEILQEESGKTEIEAPGDEIAEAPEVAQESKEAAKKGK